MKILMVCMGNICRSPMMEGWLADVIARESRLAHIQIDSAGIGAWHAGQSPDKRAIATAARHGVDISMQRARQLRPTDFDEFDLILFADAETLREGRALAHWHVDVEASRYLDWAGFDSDAVRSGDIADPYYGDMQGFEDVWRDIGEGGERILQRLLREGAA